METAHADDPLDRADWPGNCDFISFSVNFHDSVRFFGTFLVKVLFCSFRFNFQMLFCFAAIGVGTAVRVLLKFPVGSSAQSTFWYLFFNQARFFLTVFRRGVVPSRAITSGMVLVGPSFRTSAFPRPALRWPWRRWCIPTHSACFRKGISVEAVRPRGVLLLFHLHSFVWTNLFSTS